MTNPQMTEVVDAYAVISEGRYENGESIELSWDETDEALRAIKEPQ
jgi:hypothetical protein